jgi:hypothetical protein
MRKRRLSHAGNVFDQKVATSQQRNDREAHGLGLAADDALNLALERYNFFGYIDARRVGWAQLPHRIAILHAKQGRRYHDFFEMMRVWHADAPQW